MRRTKLRLFLQPFFLILILNLLFYIQIVSAAPPVNEIRTIISKRALHLPSSASLAALNANNLETALQSIDPYARYIQPYKSTSSSQSARLGIEIFEHNARLWIRPEVDGPAAKAGIPEIAELQAVNNSKVTVNDLNRISDLIDNALRNSQLSLTVSVKPGIAGKVYRLQSAQFKSRSVVWRRFGPATIIRINEFVSHETAPKLLAILSEVITQRTQVVLDLRGCSGGDFFEALEIAGMFIPAKRTLASTYDRSGVTRKYRSPSGGKTNVLVWVLIDHRTASAAEILAGILQYHHRALVVGERSFGKCVSQSHIPLSDGGGLWLTTLGVDFPDKTSCNGKGINPDINYPDIAVSTASNILNRIIKGKPTPP